jgi:hypothetical protein
MTEQEILERRAAVFEAVSREREYQDRKRGPVHDRALGVGDWILILQVELEEAREAFVRQDGTRAARQEILQVVAVGVACLESHGVVERWE